MYPFVYDISIYEWYIIYIVYYLSVLSMIYLYMNDISSILFIGLFCLNTCEHTSLRMTDVVLPWYCFLPSFTRLKLQTNQEGRVPVKK